MRLGFLSLLSFLFIAFAVTATSPASAIASTEAPSTNEANQTIGPLDRATVWIYQKQREFHRELTSRLREFARDGGWAVALAFIGVSFLYGLLHAAGPGHGKAVMSGYLVTHRETIRRGVQLSVAAAFCQGLVAILIVYGLISLAGWLPRETQTAVTWSERMSFALVALVGAYLLYRGFRGLWNKLRTKPQCTHHHDHDHVHDESCGHVHVPPADVVARATDWKAIVGLVLSIGIRPCTGAVIVLVFAKAASVPLIGIAAVLAMSAGTALAVATLAIATVSTRNIVINLPFPATRYLGHAADVAAAIGGIAILVIGLSLLATAFGPVHPIMG